MARESKMKTHLDRLLHRIETDLRTLPEIADEEPESLETHPVIVEWWGWIAEVKALQAAFTSGQMDGSQRSKYRSIVQQIREMLPLMSRLGLDSPDIPIRTILREEAATS